MKNREESAQKQKESPQKQKRVGAVRDYYDRHHFRLVVRALPKKEKRKAK